MRAQGRVARLRAYLAEHSLDAIVVRSCTDLMWLTGFEHVFDSEQAHTAVLTADACIVHTDSRYATAMKRAALGEGLWEVDDARLGAAEFVAAALGDTGLAGGNVAIDADTPLSLFRKLEEKAPDAELIELSGVVPSLRAVKEEAELEWMQRAQDVASAAFEATLARMQPGMTEREVALELEFNMRRGGADELSFPSIVASGPNSANPHAIPSERRLAAGDLVVIDFGARVNGYCSDTTRTVCIGQPTAEQQRIYDAVLAANEAVRSALKAGVTGADMQKVADDVLADAGYAGKMGHSLGHGVGLDIHESPLLSPRNDSPLPVGAVATDEPGVYIPGENGVRIEDCGAVTEDGYMNFCGLSHELQVIE